MVQNEPGVGIDEDPPLVYAEHAEMASPQIPPQPQDEWSCPQCTLLNPARKIYCIVCFHRHPDLPPANVGPGSAQNYEKHEYEEEGQNYGYGNAFAQSSAPFEGGAQSTAPFEDSIERHMVDQNIVGGAMDDGLATSQNILPGEEDPFEKKIRRRMRRKKRMAAGGAAGVVAGAILGCGPALVAAGLVGGAVGTRIVSKRQERLKDERLAMKRYQAEIQQQTPQSRP